MGWDSAGRRRCKNESPPPSPLAVAACLAATTRGLNLSIDEGLAVEAAQFARMAATSDIREGITAFLEKREPRFEGR